MKKLLLATLILLSSSQALPYEQNVITVAPYWERVRFAQTYQDPIVTVQPIEGIVVGIRNVTEDSFEVKLKPCGSAEFRREEVVYSVSERTPDSNEFNRFAWGECSQ